jgi:hypothetical protein
MVDNPKDGAMQRKKPIEPGHLVRVEGLDGVGILMTEVSWMYSNVRYADNPEVKVVEHTAPYFVHVLIGDRKVKVYSSSIVPLEESNQPQEPT